MSGLPNNFTDGTLVGIVVGGDINDPAPDQSCNMKIIIPGLHGKDVKPEHLAFSTMMKSPTKGSQSTFEGVLDPGSMVFVRKDTGSNQCHIIGTGNDLLNYDSRIPGNIDLLQPFMQFITKTIDIRIPPNITETMVNGVKVRKINEKGQLYSHSLLKSLPQNGALYPMSGFIVPTVSGIPTAIQSFTSIMTDSVAASLPGVGMSLGGLLGLITGSVAKDLFKVMPREVQASFTSMSSLIQNIETSTGGGFMTGTRVHQPTLLNNTVNLLKQCTNLSDIVSTMQRVQYDTSLYGTDQLPNSVIEVDTPFGKIKQSISPTGEINNITPDIVKKAIEAFSSLMSSSSGFPGVNPNENLFGKSAKSMQSMIDRTPVANQKVAKELLEKTNTSDIAQLFGKLARVAVQGGNPFEKMFK